MSAGQSFVYHEKRADRTDTRRLQPPQPDPATVGAVYVFGYGVPRPVEPVEHLPVSAWAIARYVANRCRRSAAQLEEVGLHEWGARLEEVAEGLEREPEPGMASHA